jgi:hypothetical protein
MLASCSGATSGGLATLEVNGLLEVAAPDGLAEGAPAELPPVPCSDPGQPCDDGDPCTRNDLCTDGVCTGKPLVCLDDLPCTEERCHDGQCVFPIRAGACLIDGACFGLLEAAPGSTGCTVCDPSQSPLQWTVRDGQPCGGSAEDCTLAHCQGKECRPDWPGGCDDGDPCTLDACDPALGCVHTPGALDCDDGLDCTVDSGDPLACTCVHTPDHAACDDGLDCTADACAPVIGCSHNPVPAACDDGNPCTADTCDVAEGCTHSPQPGPCDDGDACTVADECSGGVCAGVGCEASGLVCAGGKCVPHGEVITYGFDSDLDYFSDDNDDGWESQYCADPWTTSLNGGVFPWYDDGCGQQPCGQWANCGFDWGYWLDNWGNCTHSDPLDNHLTFGNVEWRDLVFTSRFRNLDDDTMGMVFRYTTSGSFYLFLMTRDQAPSDLFGCNETRFGSELLKVWNAPNWPSPQAQRLAESPITYTQGTVHSVRITAVGDHLRVELDTNGDGAFDALEVVFDLDDPQALPKGKVGFYAFENGAPNDPGDPVPSPCDQGGCWFDDLTIELLD